MSGEKIIRNASHIVKGEPDPRFAELSRRTGRPAPRRRGLAGTNGGLAQGLAGALRGALKGPRHR